MQDIQEDRTAGGYWADPQGRLIPDNLVKPVDKLRDQTVRMLIAAAKGLHDAISEFKKMAFGDVAEFVRIAAAEHGVQMGGLKGNITLNSYDGKYRVQRAFSAVLVYNEQAQIAKNIIDECLREWSSNSPAEIQALVADAFRVDAKGEMSVNKIYELRKIEIEDSRWQKAMKILIDSVQVDHTRSYLRLYERTNEGEYVPITLDLASVRVGEVQEVTGQ
ncbi:MAG: DUF3164 family protein [Magnetococcales bacterium]|nr:DUF3164 family protein [Magnetococcales bacterium]MBF0114699.1 DUF3164 family protein [Magnetococcales bacterium]